jgi:uncharacterized protein YcbK (DUF882 family)
MRTNQSIPHAKALIATSLIALVMSCGSQQVSTQSTTLAQKAAPLPLPMMEVKMVATMSLIDGQMADQIRARLHAPVLETQSSVDVSFRLGPKMASRTFTIGLDGEMDKAELKALRRMFRCRRSGRSHRINKGLLSKIADLAAHYEGHTLEVVSAYRHGRNASPRSRHRHGRAIDIKVVGIPAARVRDYLWARYDQEVGVGFYKQQQFVHLDHRKNYPATAWTQKHHSAENEYKPRWARPSRRDKLVVALAE